MNATSDDIDFSKVAGVYERQGEPMTLPFAERALDLIAPEPGAYVIDVAAGTGALAVAAAKRGLRVLATDILPPMVARCGERLSSYPGCDARVMSLDALDVPDRTFDASFSIIGTLNFGMWPKGRLWRGFRGLVTRSGFR